VANERRGILYETIAAVALEKAIQKTKIPGQLFWNKKPSQMSIEPDFTIGEDPEAPTHIILITASGSSSDSHKKFWRNAGELQEVKAQLSQPPIVINLYFKSVVKEGLSDLSEKLYDSTLHVDEYMYHKLLENWVNANINSSAKNQSAKMQLLQSAIKNDLALAAAIENLATDLAQILTRRNTELDPLWQLMREDYLNSLPPRPARTTAVRRGLGKLLVLEEPVRQLLYANYRSSQGLPVAQLPKYVFDLKFFTKAISTPTNRIAYARLTDSEIRSAIDLLGPIKCEIVLQMAPSSMNLWIDPLRNLERVQTHVDFVENHYEKFVDPTALRELLIDCFDDPAKLSGEPQDQTVWVYEIMISLLKAQSGDLQGYGLSKLSEDTGLAESGVGAPLVRFIIPKFVQREELPKSEHLTAIAHGLATRFQANVGFSALPKLKNDVLNWVIKENLEDRVIPYRNFEPLLWLLELELKKQGKHRIAKTAHQGWINEYAQIGKKSATTPFVQVASTLIHWKTSHSSHTNDKTKELVARERSVSYKYDKSSHNFLRRPGIEKSVIIIDGDWTDRNLRALAEAGWDLIVYPDELEDLVKKI
jgi:hypothetical protein